MNIEYQRNLKNSYMVVVEPEQSLNMDGQLAEKMIQRQHIPGLLHWMTMEREGDMTFWYRITGLQSFSDWLSHHTLDYKLIGCFLSGLLALQEELPRFYLKTEHLLLQMEQIFLDTSGQKVFFCYEPLWNKDPRQSLRELMEQLLPKIDHTDKKAVRLGYGLYEKCQEENADVWHYVMEQNTGMTTARPEICANPEPVFIPEEQTETKHVLQEQTAMQKRSIFSEKTGGKLPVMSALSWVKSLGKAKKEKPLPVCLFEPEEAEEACANPTIYLGAKQNAEGRLLYCGAGAEQSFVIEGNTFLLGGRNDQADGQLQASGVSRSHARITREDDRYYVEDLNSRNGTYLNGELLAYKEKRPVKPGDHLRFAREEFVFY